MIVAVIIFTAGSAVQAGAVNVVMLFVGEKDRLLASGESVRG